MNFNNVQLLVQNCNKKKGDFIIENKKINLFINEIKEISKQIKEKKYKNDLKDFLKLSREETLSSITQSRSPKKSEAAAVQPQ